MFEKRTKINGVYTSGVIPLAVIRVVVLRGAPRGRRRSGRGARGGGRVARARAGAEQARRPLAAPGHPRNRDALAVR